MNNLLDNLDNIIKNEQQIHDLENNISTIKKDFVKNNTPILENKSKFIIKSTTKETLFQVTQISTTYNDSQLSLRISSNLDVMFDLNSDKNTTKYKNMLLAEKGLMFIYILIECGKNGIAKKIGGRSHAFTEYELTELIKNGSVTTID